MGGLFSLQGWENNGNNVLELEEETIFFLDPPTVAEVLFEKESRLLERDFILLLFLGDFCGGDCL